MNFIVKKNKFHHKIIMSVHPKKIKFARKFNKWFLLSLKTFNDSPLIYSNVKLPCKFNPGVRMKVSMKKNGKFIEFICQKCKTKEKIPTEIVEMLDSQTVSILIPIIHLDLIVKISRKNSFNLLHKYSWKSS